MQKIDLGQEVLGSNPVQSAFISLECFSHSPIYLLSRRKYLAWWMDGWMDGWVGGWVEAKAGLRIAYSNQQKQFFQL